MIGELLAGAGSLSSSTAATPRSSSARKRASCGTETVASGARVRSTTLPTPCSTSTAPTSPRGATSSRRTRGRSWPQPRSRPAAPRRAASRTGWTSLGSASALRARPSRTAGRTESCARRVQRQRRRRRRGAAGVAAAAHPCLRGRSAGPAPARDDVADARGDHLRGDRDRPRHRAAGVAQLPPLPARCVRRLRTALGRPRGRPVRPGGAAVRGDGRRRAARQLPPARARRRDAALAAGLHRPPARRVPQPRLLLRLGLAASTSASGRRSTRSSRWAGAAREPRSSAAAAARRQRTSPP